MGKLFRASLVAAVMAVFCVIPAFAALSVSSDLPPIDFSQYIPSDWGFSESDVIYLLIKEEEEAGDIAYHCVWTVDSRWLTYDGSSAVGLIYDECSLYGHFRIYPDFEDSWGIKKFLEPQKDGVIVTGELISSNFIAAPEPSDPLLFPDNLYPSGYPEDLPRLPNFEYYSVSGMGIDNLFVQYLIMQDTSGSMFLFATGNPWDSCTYYNSSLYPVVDETSGKTYCSTFLWVDDHWECQRLMNNYDIDSSFFTGDIVWSSFTVPTEKPDDDLIPYEGPKPVPDPPEVPSHSYQTAVGDDGEVEDPDVEPGSPMEDLNLLVGSIFGILTQLYNLYAGTWLLTGFLMLWLIRRVSKLFNRL